MTKKTRRGLFYGLIALFLIVGTAIVLYAQGWRFDLETGLVSKIGGIYIQSYPKGAAISLDGMAIQNKSGFLSPGTLISDLFPKTYTVRLTQTAYHPWQEKVAVLSSFVVPLQYAVLVPQESTMVASATTERFFAWQGTVASEGEAGIISVNGKAVGQGMLTSRAADSHALIFKDTNGDYRLYGTANSTTTNLSALLRKDGIQSSTIRDVILDPHDSSQIFVTGEQKIWALGLGQQSLTLIEKTPTTKTLSPPVAVSDALISWTRFLPASNNSEIALYDRTAGNLRETSTTLAGATEKIAWIRDGRLGILQSDGSLYLYDSGTDAARKVADDVQDFSASDDGIMIAAFERSSTEIFSLDDPAAYYRFNLPDIQKVQRLIWYKDDNHLFVVYPDSISFLDLEDAGLTNFTKVAEGTSPSYDSNSNFLYFISPAGQLMSLGFPS